MVKLTEPSGGVGAPGAATEAEAAANPQAARVRPAGTAATEACCPARRPRPQQRADTSHVLRGQCPYHSKIK